MNQIYDLAVRTLAGKERPLTEYKGRVLLIANTASQCGFTPQYKGLQMLSDRYAARGLSILGFPCNQFGGQEPGTAAEIGEFCQKNYGVTFEMFEKVDVNGPDRHPLFALLLGDGSPFPGDIKWNFEKFLVDKGGGLVARYSSRIKPESQELQTKLEAALG